MSRSALLFLSTLLLPSCVISTGDKDDAAAGSDTGDLISGGGGNNDTWRAQGGGSAYLLDGELDHSRFTLELTRCVEPREGEAYHGWLLGGGAGPIYLGEIPVDEDQVLFDHELGLNAFAAGYNRFEAYASDSVPAGPGEGDPLWEGELAADVVEVLQNLLVSSPSTPNGEGSLRASETTVEVIHSYALAGIEGIDDVAVLQSRGEGVHNAIKLETADLNSDGVATTIPDINMGLIGEDSFTELIFDDLGVAFTAFGGNSMDEDLRSALDDAYDCVQNIERHADGAYDSAGVVTVCGAASSCRGSLQQAADRLQLVLDGEDSDDDGEISIDEGTVECAIEYISRMMSFDVGTP